MLPPILRSWTHAHTQPGLARLAAQLGYADQAHFSRDFKRVVGGAPSSASPPPPGATAARVCDGG